MEMPLLKVSRGCGIQPGERIHLAAQRERRVDKGWRDEGRESAVPLERWGHAGVLSRKCGVGREPKVGPAETIAPGRTRGRVGDGVSGANHQGGFQRIRDAESRHEILFVEISNE